MIIVLGFLLIVSTLCVAVLVLSQSQQGITYSYLGLDEIRYAGELGFRHALWVWRYRYDDAAYLDGGDNIYEVTLDFEKPDFEFESYNVRSVRVRVQDKNSNRKLDIGEAVDPADREIEIWVNKRCWSF